jgi:hypothetical protein
MAQRLVLVMPLALLLNRRDRHGGDLGPRSNHDNRPNTLMSFETKYFACARGVMTTDEENGDGKDDMASDESVSL